MSDRPILFSKPMILALLAGRKLQTRRAIKSARVFATPERPAFTIRGEEMTRALQNASRFRRVDGNGWFWESDAFEWQAPHERTGWLAHIGYAPGDRLWVRESAKRMPNLWHYSADETEIGWPGREPLAHFERDTCSPIRLPRVASRITLIVESIKIERLQDISEEDAIAEGIERTLHGNGSQWTDYPIGSSASGWLSPVDSYRSLWDSINGAGAWAANPFVVAYGFKCIPRNIDQIGGGNG